MTIDTLKEYAYLVAEIEALQREIVDASYPVSSPNGRETIGSPGNTPSNPTERSAFSMMELRALLVDAMKKSIDLRIEIEGWLATVDNSEIRAIVRTHFINGPKQTNAYHRHWEWADTCEAVYGYRDNRHARRKVTDYLKREQEVKEDEGELDTDGCETAE